MECFKYKFLLLLFDIKLTYLNEASNLSAKLLLISLYLLFLKLIFSIFTVKFSVIIYAKFLLANFIFVRL